MTRLCALTAVVLGAVTWACAPTSAEPLPQLPPGGSLGLALGVASVPNLRDMGGYQTRDGRAVARGLVYRSNAFSGMSAEDIKKIAPLGLKNDYDLRLTAEAKAAPDEVPRDCPPSLAERDGRREVDQSARHQRPAAPAETRPTSFSATARSRRCSSRATASSSRCRAPTGLTGRCSFRWPTARTCRRFSIAPAARTAPVGPPPPC